MENDPAYELVGLKFLCPQLGSGGLYSSKNHPWTVTEFDGENLLIVHDEGYSNSYAWKMTPSSFEAAWDIGGWTVVETDRECVNTELGCFYSPNDDDFLCKWCRYSQAWKEKVGA